LAKIHHPDLQTSNNREDGGRLGDIADSEMMANLIEAYNILMEDKVRARDLQLFTLNTKSPEPPPSPNSVGRRAFMDQMKSNKKRTQSQKSASRGAVHTSKDKDRGSEANNRTGVVNRKDKDGEPTENYDDWKPSYFKDDPTIRTLPTMLRKPRQYSGTYSPIDTSIEYRN
jgi:hypothetical protein